MNQVELHPAHGATVRLFHPRLDAVIMHNVPARLNAGDQIALVIFIVDCGGWGDNGCCVSASRIIRTRSILRLDDERRRSLMGLERFNTDKAKICHDYMMFEGKGDDEYLSNCDIGVYEFMEVGKRVGI